MSHGGIKEIDPVDAALFVIGTLSAGMLVGIVKVQAFDVGFAETLFAPAGFELSTAWVLGYAAILGIIVTNDNAKFSELGDDIQNLDTYYAATAAATLALPVAFVVFPETIGSFFESRDLYGMVYIFVVGVGQLALGWML